MTAEQLQDTVQLYSNVTILLILGIGLASLTIWYRLGRR